MKKKFKKRKFFPTAEKEEAQPKQQTEPKSKNELVRPKKPSFFLKIEVGTSIILEKSLESEVDVFPILLSKAHETNLIVRLYEGNKNLYVIKQEADGTAVAVSGIQVGKFLSFSRGVKISKKGTADRANNLGVVELYTHQGKTRGRVWMVVIHRLKEQIVVSTICRYDFAICKNHQGDVTVPEIKKWTSLVKLVATWIPDGAVLHEEHEVKSIQAPPEDGTAIVQWWNPTIGVGKAMNEEGESIHLHSSKIKGGSGFLYPGQIIKVKTNDQQAATEIVPQ